MNEGKAARRTWLAAQELPVHDPHVLFNLLDDGDAELTAEELVKGVERLKGTAKGIDLASFIAEYRHSALRRAKDACVIVCQKHVNEGH